MKVFIGLLLFLHAAIHVFGYLKARSRLRFHSFPASPGRLAGISWLVVGSIFLIALVMFLASNESWWIPAVPAIVISEILIARSWQDLKYGTLPNLILTIPVFCFFVNSLPSSFRNRYESEVMKRLRPDTSLSIVSERDIKDLPNSIRRYIKYTGNIGKPKICNFTAQRSGVMKRRPDDAWFTTISRQYDFFVETSRILYIESTLFGVPFDGLRIYADSCATMKVKAAHVFRVADAKGIIVAKDETVTLFNDMCVLAPATLIDAAIKWKELDSMTVEGKFSHNGYTVSALLSFNEAGALVNFLSNDRYYSTDGNSFKNYPWSTPLSDYRDYGGRMVASRAEQIWHSPQGNFTYAKFILSEIDYNRTLNR